MKKYAGLIFVKHGRIGSKSEGPDYFLQTNQAEYPLQLNKRQLWKPDYELEFYCRRMVEIEGEFVDKILNVKSIKLILDQNLPSKKKR